MMQRQSLTTSHKQTDAQSLSNSCFGKPLLLPQFLLLNMMLDGREYPFDQLESAVPALCPPNLFTTPPPTCWGERERGRSWKKRKP